MSKKEDDREINKKHLGDRSNRFNIRLSHIENQTEDICLAAVRKNGFVLHFVKNQTEEICTEAVKQNRIAISLCRDQK